MMHERNQDARWSKPLESLNFVEKMLTIRIAIRKIALVKTFVFKVSQKIVPETADNLSVMRLSNLRRGSFFLSSISLLIESDYPCPSIVRNYSGGV